MKGIVFTEFMEMIESRFSPALVDRVVEGAVLSSGGSYTAVGTYDHSEMLQLVTRLSYETGSPIPDLVRAFGQHLFQRFTTLYPDFFADIDSAYAFLRKVDGYIHIEVRKLYPDAELPSIDCSAATGNAFALVYRSARPFADLAEGLIQGCIDHFGTPIVLRREDLSNGKGTAARFVLTPKATAP